MKSNLALVVPDNLKIFAYYYHAYRISTICSLGHIETIFHNFQSAVFLTVHQIMSYNLSASSTMLLTVPWGRV